MKLYSLKYRQFFIQRANTFVRLYIFPRLTSCLKISSHVRDTSYGLGLKKKKKEKTEKETQFTIQQFEFVFYT